MYKTQATLKNINLRTEFQGEDERHGAFDLKVEAPLTPELHLFLCKHTEKAVPIKQLIGSGLAQINYGIELENILFTIGEHEIRGAKLNKVIGKLGGKQIAVMRVQSQIHHKGLIDDLNDITGDPMTITIEELQGDLLEDQTEAVKPDPESKNIAPEQKVMEKNKAAKKAHVAKKKAKATAKKPTGGASSAELSVVGAKKDDLTDEEIAARQKEKEALLARTVKAKPEITAQDEVQQALDMVLDLETAKMGQGDELEFNKMRERLDAGKPLSMTQAEQLNDLYNKYAA